MQDKLSHGWLPNGMRYCVRSNARPAQRAALSLVVRVGSLAEVEAERGVAHFLEHLAFNATELYDRHALVAHLESAGLEFGACQNAYTSCDETVFELLVPLDVPDLLTNTFSILAQFASCIRIAPADVEAERGAILEEWRSGRSSSGRASEAAWKLLHAGSLYADRLPIGLESVIRGVSAEAIRAFYSRWYWPQNMALVAVGDWSDEERCAVVASVTQLFGTLSPPVGAPAVPPALPVATAAAHSEPRAACHMEPALTQSSILVVWKAPRLPLASARDYRLALVRQVFERCLSARLFRASRGASPPFYSAAIQLDSPVAGVETASLSASTPVGGILVALRALLRAVAVVRAHGFTPAEVARARSRLEAENEQNFAERDQAYSTALRDEYVRHVTSGEAVMDSELEYRLSLSLLRSISDADVAACAANLTLADSCVVRAACGAAERHPPTEQELLAVLREEASAEAAGNIPPPADFEACAPAELLPSLPALTPGAAIADRRSWPQFGASELRLCNGLRVAFKRTAILDDQILIVGAAHGGLSEVGGGELYSSAVCASVLAGEAGIFGHSPEELDDILAGRRCNVSPNIGAYGRDFSGDTSPADLDCALSLIHLLFTTTPKADGAASLAVPLRLMREYIRSRRRDPFWNFKTTVKRLNYGDSYYLRPLTERDLDRVRPAAALDFFAAAFANPAAFTICLVGALPEDGAALESLIVQYLGTIPATDQPAVIPPSLVTPLPFAFPKSPIRQEVRVTMPEPQAAAQLSWPLTIASSVSSNGDARAVSAVVMREMLTVRLACRILETRLLKLLRFRFGDVYSVTVNPYYGMEAPSATPPLHGDCAVSFSCDPDAAWRLVELALDELAVLQADGPSAEDCTTAVELERRAFELSQAENSYWLERLLAPYQVRLFGLRSALLSSSSARLSSLADD